MPPANLLRNEDHDSVVLKLRLVVHVRVLRWVTGQECGKNSLSAVVLRELYDLRSLRSVDLLKGAEGCLGDRCGAGDARVGEYDLEFAELFHHEDTERFISSMFFTSA
jgi:hypothetical protein